MSPLCIQDLRRKGVYFYFAETTVSFGALHYAVDALVSGLQGLEIPVYSNLSLPRFRALELAQCRAEILVFSVTEVSYNVELMEAIDVFVHPRKCIVNMSDGANTTIMAPSVLSFMAHENRFLHAHGRRSPWAFGLTNERMEQAQKHMRPFPERRRIAMRTFRPSHYQSVRDTLDLALLPGLSSRIEIDPRVGSEDYYERMGSSMLCLAYGGHIAPDLSANSQFMMDDGFRKASAFLSFERSPVIVRWDSYRFWESLACGCLTLQLDMEKYGFLLPVSPVAWRDYVPVDLEDPKGTIERLMDMESHWAEIAESGRAWSLCHYSPRAVSLRFLREMGCAELPDALEPPSP